MVWQDIIISLANLLFVFSLVNQVSHGFILKKAFIHPRTSVFTSVGLYVMSICFFTLGLFMSSVICFINGSLWLTLFLQHFFFEKAK